MDLISERSNQTVNSDNLYRCWANLTGLSALSVDEINRHKNNCKELGIYPTMDYYYMDREQRINDETARICKLIEYLSEKRVIKDRAHPVYYAVNPHFFGLSNHGFGLHLNAFVKSIELLADEEQREKWLPKCYSFEVIGCYAQTELGHGSDLKSLETTATFDPDTDQFIINSPTISSHKFWPGGLGKHANHALVFAQTFVKGKHVGLQSFIVPIRDRHHTPLEEVHIGDIGTKYSFNSTDNGFAKFKNLRIPRQNMLSRYAHITSDGEFTVASEKAVRLGYGNMLFLRVFFFYGRCISLSKVATIAIRYSIVRKQFKEQETKKERQILDYQTQQMRLFPILGISYAIALSSQTLMKMYRQYESELRDGGEPFQLLTEVHVLCSALKPLATWKMRKFGEIVKQCCGGHGFLEISGIHRIVKEEEALTTAEGANNVILQQTARYLLGQCQKIIQGDSLDTICEYLSEHFPAEGKKQPVASNFKSLNEIIINAFQRRTAVFLSLVANKFQKLMGEGLSLETVWNEKTQQQFIKVSEYFGETFMITEAFNVLSSTSLIDDNSKEVIEKCLQIYAIYTILDELNSFLYTDFFTENDVENLRKSFREELQQIRKNAIGIVDGFGYKDEELLSVLGSYDGEVYQKMMDVVRKNPWNKKNVLPGYFEYIKPLRAKI